MNRTHLKWLVGGHAAVALLHGLAHLGIPVGLSLFGWVYVAVFVGVLPWVALQRRWAWLLAGTMLAAFCFGVYNHYIVEGADHVAHIPHSRLWQPVFQVSAFGLMILEGAGVVVGLLWMRRGA